MNLVYDVLLGQVEAGEMWLKRYTPVDVSYEDVMACKRMERPFAMLRLRSISVSNP